MQNQISFLKSGLLLSLIVAYSPLGLAVDSQTQKPNSQSQKKSGEVKESSLFPKCSMFSDKSKQRAIKESEENDLDQEVEFILISKSRRKMIVFSKDEILKQYSVSLGFTPKGHKVEEGDGRTPEGLYQVEYKLKRSQFHRALKISYPNQRDLSIARSLGVEAGGNVMIHGEPSTDEKKALLREMKAERGQVDWTHGCVAIGDDEITEVFDNVKENTPIRICP